MKWEGREQSEHVEDRRGSRGRQVVMGGGILSIIAIVIGLLMGGDPQQLLRDLGSGGHSGNTNSANYQESEEEKNLMAFAKVTLADNEKIWTNLFQQNGMQYQKPTMVVFSENTETGCGMGDARMGPFYCPADQKVYLSLSFFNELTQKLGAHGDFAFAYVIAHEVGHHVQNLLGTSNKVRQAQSQVDEVTANKYSVAMELQADFYAGVWAHYNAKWNNALEEGDVEEALSAANAVGDDRLQKRAQGYVVPDAFTHGSSEQRMFWFMKGFKTGDLNQGNTFDQL